LEKTNKRLKDTEWVVTDGLSIHIGETVDANKIKKFKDCHSKGYIIQKRMGVR